MKIYRKIIPRIAKDVVRALLANQAIEIEDGHRDEAELDVASVFVRYLNELEQLNEDAKEALERHNLSHEALGRVKSSLAEKRNLVIGTESLEYVLGAVISGLFNSEHILEIFAEDHEMRQMVHTTIGKYLGVDSELDREVRHRLKNLREGTAEWEVEYTRLIDQMRGHKLEEQL